MSKSSRRTAPMRHMGYLSSPFPSHQRGSIGVPTADRVWVQYVGGCRVQVDGYTAERDIREGKAKPA